MDRRHFLGNALVSAAAAAGLTAAGLTAAGLTATGEPGATAQLASAGPSTTAVGSWTTQTLEAFTDTLIPGAKRFSGDVAVAGAASGPGGAHAGFMTLLTDPRLGVTPLLDGIAALLNARAAAYAIAHFIWVPPWQPAFVALSYRHRGAVVAGLFQPSDPDHDLWSTMALLSSFAFDTAAHRPTAQAIAEGHPGLAYIGYPPPGPDGLWRYPDFSYRRAVASVHPTTTPEGHPA